MSIQWNGAWSVTYLFFIIDVRWAYNRRVYEPKIPPMSKCDHLISVATNFHCVRPLISLLYLAKKICKYMRIIIMNEKKRGEREAFIHAKSPAYNNSIYLWHCASMEISEWNKIFIGRAGKRAGKRTRARSWIYAMARPTINGEHNKMAKHVKTLSVKIIHTSRAHCPPDTPAQLCSNARKIMPV